MIKLTIDQFIQKAREVHRDKYDYSLVEYENNTTKVKIICPIHGIFEQIPDKHIRGVGCHRCGCRNNQKLNTKDIIQKAREVHGDKYDYSLVEYRNCKTKIKIICPTHGVFEQYAYIHLRGHGCLQCKGKKISNTKKSLGKTTEQFIEEAKSVHGDKYDYSSTTYNRAHDRIKIICPIHGVFEQSPTNHLQPNGCPKCACAVSRQETELQEWISSIIDIEVRNRSIISPYELDVVIPSKKIAIEYNGLYWHSEQQGKCRNYHLLKHQLCEEAGYRLIQIWENEWEEKKDIVKSIILSAIGIYERKIGARQCKVEDIDITTARQFYDDNHIQGFKGGKHKGLFYKGKLVSMMTIYNNILERFVSKCGYRIIGAFSKLLKSFNINKSIVTFSDLRYFTGDVYRKNGFTFLYNSDPNYFYFNTDRQLHSRVSFQKHKLKDKLEVFDPNLTEYQNMLNNGYHRIWDCGNAKFVMESYD